MYNIFSPVGCLISRFGERFVFLVVFSLLATTLLGLSAHYLTTLQSERHIPRSVAETMQSTDQHSVLDRDENQQVMLDILLSVTATLLFCGYLVIGLCLQRTRALSDIRRRSLVHGGHWSYDGDLKLLNTQITELQVSRHLLRDKITSVIEEVANAAQEVVNMSERGVQSSSDQKDSVASIATAIQQMVLGINEAAEKATQTYDFSHIAIDLSDRGYQVIDSVVKETHRIGDLVEKSAQEITSLESRSNEIGAIVHVIEEVAEQINLLALNAAIEAARAGESGRGFAVVADEVRNLASRTHDATNQVSELIKATQLDIKTIVASVRDVRDSTGSNAELVDQAKGALMKIKSGAQDNQQMVEVISNSLTEQSATSEEISATALQINDVLDAHSEDITDASQIATYLLQLTKILASDLADIEKLER